MLRLQDEATWFLLVAGGGGRSAWGRDERERRCGVGMLER